MKIRDPIRTAILYAYSHGPMHRRRDARRFDRAAHVGAMLGFLAMWGMLAAACWAAGGVQ